MHLNLFPWMPVLCGAFEVTPLQVSTGYVRLDSLHLGPNPF